MTLSNTTHSYGLITKSFHWLTALLILTVIPLGIIAQQMPYATSTELAEKAWMFSLHKTVGVTLFIVALARILWAISQPKPGPLHPDRKAETFLAEAVHWLLYGSLVLVPLTGWIHHAATEGFAPILWPFGQNLPFISKSVAVAETFAALHIIFERVLVGSLLLHILGALKHVVIDKDGTLSRMWFGASKAELLPPHKATRLAPLFALVVWAAALGIGAGLGLFTSHHETVQEAELIAAPSGWTVQDGAIEITVQQLGSGVTGAFDRWTAAINFDPEARGPAGDVAVEIDIGSLSLGTVTGQALGSEFFAASDFPTARYEADIIANADAFTAEGTITIRDTSVPISFPFELEIDGDTARMQGQLTLDRRDFGIGVNYPDEQSVGFAVVVDLALTALKSGLE